MRTTQKEYWAVFYRGAIALCDYRVPVFWLKSQAFLWAKEHGMVPASVVRVRVVRAKKGGAK